MDKGQNKINLSENDKADPGQKRNLFKIFADFFRPDRLFRRWMRGSGQENMVADSRRILSGFNEHVSCEGYDQQASLKTTVAGLDIETGMDRFGSEEVYAEVLRSYAHNTRPLLDSIRNPAKKNLSKYAICVHGIKGSSYGISAFAVGYKAEALENAANAGDFDYVSNNNNDFIDMVETLISNIVDLLDEINPRTDKPKKDKPDRELLVKLMTACAKYDMDEVDAMIAEIDVYEYESGGDLVPWLRENASLTNFLQIRERLLVLIDTLV